MADDRRVNPPPRARAVLDPALESVLVRAEDLAKRWSIALIGARSLDAMASVPLEELAREGPSVCAQMLRALQSDVELERLTGSGAAGAREGSALAGRLAAMTGAGDGATAVEAVEALRGVLWEALLGALVEPPARLLADLSDRLAYVCACALAASIGATLTSATLTSATPLSDIATDGMSASAQAEREVPGRGATTKSDEGSPFAGAVIVDEREDVRLARGHGSIGSPIRSSSSAQQGRASEAERPLSWDESPPIAPAGSPARARQLASEAAPATPGAAGEEIEIRDERGEEGPSAWIGSIGRQVTRFEHDRHPFAVLLVELLDIEQIGSRESVAELSRLSGQVQDVLAAELRTVHSGSLTRERPGRYWLLVPETDRGTAQRLLERLAGAVAASVSYRGAPLEVAIGSAFGPEDGLRAPALAAHADVGLYAARSSFRRARERATAAADEPA
jgi:GGDEF domain-containing protein